MRTRSLKMYYQSDWINKVFCVNALQAYGSIFNIRAAISLGVGWVESSKGEVRKGVVLKVFGLLGQW